MVAHEPTGTAELNIATLLTQSDENEPGAVLLQPGHGRESAGRGARQFHRPAGGELNPAGAEQAPLRPRPPVEPVSKFRLERRRQYRGVGRAGPVLARQRQDLPAGVGPRQQDRVVGRPEQVPGDQVPHANLFEPGHHVLDLQGHVAAVGVTVEEHIRLARPVRPKPRAEVGQVGNESPHGIVSELGRDHAGH